MNLKNSKLEKILDEKTFTRSDDKALFITYLQDYHCETEIEKAIIEVILEMPKESSLTRTRAFYQNKKGMYLPWVATVNKRKEAQDKCRQEYSTKGLFDWLARFFKKF